MSSSPSTRTAPATASAPATVSSSTCPPHDHSSYPGMSCLPSRPPRLVTVAATQFACTSSIATNLATATSLVRSAASQGAQIILLQELFSTPYFCQHEHPALFSLASSSITSMNFLLTHFQSLSRELSVVLPISFFEKDPSSPSSYYNSLKVYDCGDELPGLYRKSHIPTGPGYHEKYYFRAGDTGFKVWETSYGRIGVGICWDQWHAEAAKCMALNGAELLFYPTAIGSEPEFPNLDSSEHWKNVMIGHAAGNMCPVIASNRIGKELNIEFYGNSFIADGTGKVVKEAKKGEGEMVLIHQFDLQALEEARVGWGIFRDRRPELYGAIVDGRGANTQVVKYHLSQPHNSISSLQPSSVSSFSSVIFPSSHSSPPAPLSSSSSSSFVSHLFSTSSPASLGYYMPAEWSPHCCCYIILPFRLDNWHHQAIPAQTAFISFANQLSEFEEVRLLVRKEDWEMARKKCGEKVKVVEMSSDDSWIRDSGPTFVVKKRDNYGNHHHLPSLAAIHWRFNGYGGSGASCYPSWSLDSLLPSKLSSLYSFPLFSSCPWIFEGGALHVDGEGTAMVTEECLLNWNRWGEETKEERDKRKKRLPREKQVIEQALHAYLNVSKVIWLEFGLYGDEDTNGHIDNMACFSSPGHVILSWTDDETDPQYDRSKKAEQRLKKEKDAKGRELNIHKMHLPRPMFIKEEEVESLEAIVVVVEEGEGGGEKKQKAREVGTRLPTSYVNFYIGNGCVFVPGFGDEIYDGKAVELLKGLFPDRTVVQIYSRDIVLGGGNLHCITQQQPTPVD